MRLLSRASTIRIVPILSVVFSFAAAVFEERSALAANADTEKSERMDDTSSEHLQGLELTLRPTFGSVGSASPLKTAGPNASSSDIPRIFHPGTTGYGSSFGAGLQIGYRFHPLISAGLRGDFGTVTADRPTGGTTSISRDWQSAGLYARVYPLALNERMRRHLDPWIATGITYVHDSQTFVFPTATSEGSKVDATYSADSHAIGIPIGIGVDYRVTNWFSLGPSFEYVIMNPVAGCIAASASGFEGTRTCTDQSPSLEAKVEGTWHAGLTLRITPF